MDTRCLHITGNQSLQLLRAAREGQIVSAGATDRHDVAPFPKAFATLEDLKANDLLEWLNVSAESPLEVLVPSAGERRCLTGMHMRTLSVDVPPTSFLELREGSDSSNSIHLPNDLRIFIEAPSLALARAAVALMGGTDGASGKDDLDAMLRLIALANEFCGRYARDPLKPSTGKAYYDKPTVDGRFTNPEELQRALRQLRNVDGVARARLAAKYAIDESGSPMETYLNMGLTLPPRLAGFSMEQPLANKQLRYASPNGVSLRHKSLRPDLQWPSIRFLIEYLGDKEHASKGARVEDKNRLQDYAATDYKAVFLMYDDIRSVQALNKTALMVAREFAKHGKTFEPHRVKRLMRDDEFHQRQMTLVAKLLPPVSY